MYTKSQQIEERFAKLLHLIQEEPHSTSTLAAALSLSRPTIARCLLVLRQRGHVIRACKESAGWRYKLCQTGSPTAQETEVGK